MYDYSFMFPSILVLAILMIFYFLRPRLHTRQNRAFFSLMALECLTVFFVILSSLADENYQKVGKGLLIILNTGFFLCFLTRTYGFFRFTTDLLNLWPEEKPVVKWVARSLFMASFLIVLSGDLTGAVYSITEEGYQQGPLYFILYVNLFVYMAASAVILLVYRRELNLRQLAAGLGYNGVLLAGGLVRIIYPTFLVMDMFCLIAILIIFLAFENPEFFISDRGPAFNTRAFHEMLEEKTRRRYRVLGFVLRNYVDNRGIFGGKQLDQGITLVNEFLVKSFPKLSVFYLRNGCFTIVGDADLSWSEVRQTIFERFQQPWKAMDADLFLSVAFVQISWKSRIRSTDRIINNLLLAFEEAGKLADPVNSIVDLDQANEIDKQVDVKRALEAALKSNAVEVFLQPIVDSHTRKVVAAEALARIRDEEGRLISPLSFIPIAEKSGHIMELGEQVLDGVCRFVSRFGFDELGLSWINVNLSPVQCLRKDLGQRYNAILQRYGVRSDLIHLELTEQSISDFAALYDQIESLKSSGFQFVLDDYGSGYSNLNRVKHYPFVNIKLDMEVVWDYYRERDILIPAMLEAFKGLGHTITCEGIESEEMADVMTEVGSDYLQGYYFAKPLPMDEFVRRFVGSEYTEY